MTCTKTGARVYLVEYDQTLPADVFVVKDCTIFRLNMALFDTEDSVWGMSEEATHSVYIGSSENSWWRKDLGVLVVPTCYVTEVK